METPSDFIFSSARSICDDMKDLVDDATMELDQYSQMLRGMRNCLRETKANLEKHAVPLQGRKTKERRALRKKIRAIEHAMQVAKKLEETLCLTMDDMDQIMGPFNMDPKTHKFLEKIMDDEPTDGELKDIEENDG